MKKAIEKIAKKNTEDRENYYEEELKKAEESKIKETKVGNYGTVGG